MTYSENFKKTDWSAMPEDQHPEAHTINEEKVPPDGGARPKHEGWSDDKPMTASKPLMSSKPIGLSYAKGDFSPYIQHCGEGLMPSFDLDFINDIPFSCGNVHPHTALMLFTLVLNQRPQAVVETGTSYGYSTWFIAQALQVWGEGIIHTIDVTDSLIAPEIHSHDHIQVHTGHSSNVLGPLCEELGEVQFAFLDSYKRLAYHEFQTVDPFIPPGGIVVFHDTQMLNTGRHLYTQIKHGREMKWAHSYEFILFSGLPHKDNPHKYFGNADDRGLFVLRKKPGDFQESQFLEVNDFDSARSGAGLLGKP